MMVVKNSVPRAHIKEFTGSHAPPTPRHDSVPTTSMPRLQEKTIMEVGYTRAHKCVIRGGPPLPPPPPRPPPAPPEAVEAVEAVEEGGSGWACPTRTQDTKAGQGSVERSGFHSGGLLSSSGHA